MTSVNSSLETIERIEREMRLPNISSLLTETWANDLRQHADALAEQDAELERLRARVAELEQQVSDLMAGHVARDRATRDMQEYIDKLEDKLKAAPARITEAQAREAFYTSVHASSGRVDVWLAALRHFKIIGDDS